MDLADREGADALSLRRLADVLGVHPTSLYNHVASKEDLLAGVVEWLFEAADLPTEVDHWADWVRGLASGLRELARRHPGAFYVLTKAPTTGPVAAAQTELALDAFRRGGFSTLAAGYAATATSLALLGLALNEGPQASAVGWPEPTGPLSSETLAAEGYDLEGPWSLLVEALVAGLAAQVDR